MKRRHFLKRAAQAGIGLGVSGSLSTRGTTTPPALAVEVGEEARTLPPKDKSGRANSSEIAAAGTSTLSLDGEWRIATDPQNLGREKQWFSGPVSEAKTTRVPSIIQEVFPAYHGVA